MDNQNPNPAEVVPGAAHVEASGGEANGGADMSLKELNLMLGREYKDVPTAMAAIKETYGFVGKKVETATAVTPAPAAQANDTHASKDEVKQLRDDLFFSQNPQYNDYRSLINKLGANPSEVVVSEEFKTVFEKAKSADDAKNSRSVVSSNARLASSSTKLDEAVKASNAVGIGSQSVAEILAAGILEDYQVE